MPVDAKIETIDPRSALLQGLVVEARAQGYAFMDRLGDEARSGDNVFERPGECFCAMVLDGVVIGCGGLNRDPYTDLDAGRLRHIYVLRAYRRQGIAAALVRELLRRAKPAFAVVRLRTPDESAGKFYDALGFRRGDDPTATHIIEI